MGHSSIAIAFIGLIISPLSALAQAQYTETFDAAGSASGSQSGPSGLISRGWTFRRQGSPLGTGVWNSFGQGWAYEGEGCLNVNGTIAQVGSQAAAWAVLPAVPGQQGGDPLALWVSQAVQVGASPTGRFQVRYSPTGGTSTGSSAADIGDFTQLLLDIPGLPNGAPWSRVSATVPGAGRLALRVFQPGSANASDYAANFLIDSLAVGTTPSVVPFPAAGATVHWTTAMSPINLPPQHLTIVAGSIVVVDPGVRVNLSPTYRLDVRGTIDVREGATINVPASSFPPSELNVYGAATFVGTASTPVNLIGGARDWAATTERFGAMPGGRITARYINLQSTLSALNTGVVVADHVNASGLYTGFFTSGQIYTTGGTIAVRDSSFTNGAWININGGYLLADRISLDNSQLYTGRYHGGQTMYLNNITARNHPDSCFHLTGYDHFFGPSNIIEGNGFPVHLYGAGIARGSTLPATGNINNMVHGGIGTIVGQATFARLGVPYRIDSDLSMPDNMGGILIIDPGVTVKMGPNAYIPASFGSTLGLKGLPEAPITFERLDPAAAWTDLWFAVNRTRPRVEHCIIRGADRGVDADETLLRVESCLFEGNRIGVSARNYLGAIVRKTRFFGNEIGAQSSYGSPATGFGHGFIDADIDDGKPNWFEGNTIGLSTLNPLGDQDLARGNYWASPSGPTDETNPGGTGQPTPGPNVVVPFLATPPSIADTPPIVRLEEHSFLMDEGDKVILHWTARDDHAITRFQIWHSTHNENPGLYLLVDNIPATARSWEVTVPEAPPASNYPDASVFRVVAIDDSQQQGYDEILFRTPWLHDVTYSLAAAPMPALAHPGEPLNACLMPGQAYFDAWLFLDGDSQSYSMGGTTTNCLSGTQSAPPVSTDLARVMVSNGAAGGRTVYAFSNYFSIRPDSAIGDAPPQVTLTAPVSPISITGGGTVHLAWTASDDEGLRGFDIHASYNGGRTWHTVTHDLPATARAFDWRLPPSRGIADVRVRVLARDLRFQNSSSTSGQLTITPGSAPVCVADFDASGDVAVADIFAFLNAWLAGLPAADFNGGGLSVQDIFDYLNAWFAGCH